MANRLPFIETIGTVENTETPVQPTPPEILARRLIEFMISLNRLAEEGRLNLPDHEAEMLVFVREIAQVFGNDPNFRNFITNLRQDTQP